jgi:hypothetical protein
LRRILVAGLLGTVALIVWTFVVDALLGYKRSIEMDQLPAERAVYEVLRQHVTEPGRYVCNPEVRPGEGFPGHDPVFSIQYSGVGHADAGQEMIVSLVVMLFAPILAACMLSKAADRTLKSYGRKVLFFVRLGVIVALFSDVARFGIGGYSMGDALALALHDLLAWTFVGLVVAWRIRPEAPSAASTATHAATSTAS